MLLVVIKEKGPSKNTSNRLLAVRVKVCLENK